ncbi:MAG: hypothetical protein ACD_35C00079G0006 [uncultured bacterium]|nr:MAG: hypothetical protein ACD_35C00079G0006 [uncultured bacterium]HCS40973.1 hypothetical protein [Anaerolineaceae bacterium]
MAEAQQVKLLMTWDIIPEHEQEYFEFVIRDFIPGVQRLGCELSDAWATVYGDQPQILVGAVISSLNRARQLISSQAWIDLNLKLMEYVQNYEQKIIPAKTGFQL